MREGGVQQIPSPEVWGAMEHFPPPLGGGKVSATQDFTIDLGQKKATITIQALGPSAREPTAPTGFTKLGEVDCGALGKIYVYVKLTIA